MNKQVKLIHNYYVFFTKVSLKSCLCVFEVYLKRATYISVQR